jgi:hypothetical protein
MAEETRVATQCEQCGAVDTHPKAHWNDGGTYHHDCIPFKLKNQLIETTKHAEAVIKAAESGIRGDALLAHIESLHTADKDAS